MSLFVGFLSLVTYNMRDVWFGTPLHIAAASDGSSVDSLVFPIAGSAVHAKSVTINGRPIGIEPNGHFSDEVILSNGYNVVEVTLLDRFGKQKTQVLHVVAHDTASLAQAETKTYQP